MKLIPLTQGKFAKVDDEWFEYLNQWKWYFRSGYAVRMGMKNGKRITLRMHREIKKPPENMQVDHVDNDRLNNQYLNLRVCTNAQNQHNTQKKSSNKSGFKGVSWISRYGKWVAQIEKNGKGRTIGYFSNPSDAAVAYDKVARELFGEFAKTNF